MPTEKKNTLIIVPPNDPEAVLILRLAQAMGLDVMASGQAHGASLDRGRDFISLVKKGGWERVVVVEMPGEKSEKALRALGVELTIIDHHQYGKLDRARNEKTGKPLPSSLEQFLKLFRLTDSRLSKLGFDPRLVRAVGIMDRGFVWALKEEGYSKKEIEYLLAYQKELMASVKEPKDQEKKEQIIQSAWERRESWQGYLIVQDDHTFGIRPGISLRVALEIGKPTPLIIVEKKRGFIYVQESVYAQELLKQFGGFTFGMRNNWGYRNQKGKKRVTLKDVQEFLAQQIA